MRLQPPELRRARIEIVPMIDTIFFLLVFFMITSLSMIKLNSKKVALPESETATVHPVNQVTLTVDKEGRFLVMKEEIPEELVVGRLTKYVKANPAVQIVLNCDKELPVSYFMKAYEDAKRANASQVMVATSPRARRGS
jgi:biopolymer transport protein ExbD